MKGKTKRKHRKRRAEKKEVSKILRGVSEEEKDAVDKLIDCDFETFKRGIIEERVPIGQLHGIRMILNNSYALLKEAKDALMQRIKECPEEEEECKYNIQRCYLVMEKIEEKSVWLSEREKSLLTLGK